VYQVGNQPRLYYDAGQPTIKMTIISTTIRSGAYELTLISTRRQ